MPPRRARGDVKQALKDIMRFDIGEQEEPARER